MLRGPQSRSGTAAFSGDPQLGFKFSAFTTLSRISPLLYLRPFQIIKEHFDFCPGDED